ncbi:MAG: fumarate hydratase [Thermodesulfovibrionales bacterium]|nr:fumarate hydratase [Thermodesulfovibrionales bacterium]
MFKKEISEDQIIFAVRKLFLEAVTELPEDVCEAFEESLKIEESLMGRSVIEQLLKNKDIAKEESLALCQDTGFAVVFIEWGSDVYFRGKSIYEAVNEGVRRAYSEGYFRKSIVNDPVFDRKNTNDNTPCILHLEMVNGDKVKITVAPKGGGSENMSAIKMLKPADGLDGIKSFVLETVEKAGGNPCPPIIVGIGIGGTFEKCALLSKKALLRKLGESNPDPRYAELEKLLLIEINKLGIGPMGLGGRVTALAVNIEYFPCHIASLPVAVNIQCNSARHKEVIL